MMYAGVRPARVRSVVSLDGFGIPARGPARRAREVHRVARCARNPPEFAPYATSPPSPIGCRRTIRGCRATRPQFLARPLGRSAARRNARDCAPTRATSCRFPTSTGWRRSSRSGVGSPRRRCGSRPPIRTFHAGWPAPRGEAAPTELDGVRTPASRTSRTRTLADIADAGHMLHHDQPEAVARRSSRSSPLDAATTLSRAFAARRLRRARTCSRSIWGSNWIVMKLALAARAARSSSTSQRTWLAMLVLFAVLVARRKLAAAGIVAGRRRHRASSRRRSTSARRRWRWPAAAPDARRCSCSRCRSGRC